VLEAANLFREVKDIRDELHMLRAIAEYQKSVQEDAPWFAASSKEVTAQSIIDNLRDMDKAAERIETAVRKPGSTMPTLELIKIGQHNIDPWPKRNLDSSGTRSRESRSNTDAVYCGHHPFRKSALDRPFFVASTYNKSAAVILLYIIFRSGRCRIPADTDMGVFAHL
jgi:hypothetical protein